MRRRKLSAAGTVENPEPRPAEGLTLPTFFIIGAAKAGTTSLHHYLDLHPEIQMSAVKEPNFFAGPANGIPYPVGRVERLDEYEGLFDPAYKVRGEASPSYTNAPRREGVPERIRKLVPEARLIYLVRDPIARTVSQHQMRVADGKDRHSIGVVLAELDSVNPHSFYLTCQSFYARQLKLYLPHFPQERIMVIDQADLRADRQATLREVFAFLSVEEDFTSERFDAELYAARDRRVNTPFFNRWLKPALAAPARRLPARLRDAVRGPMERALLPALPAPELDQRSRTRLKELYADDTARLRELTGKPFESWSI